VLATDRAQLEALLEVSASAGAAGVVGLTLDLSGLDLGDRVTLEVLVALAAALHAGGGRLCLVGAGDEQVDAALEAASLDEVFVLHEVLGGPTGRSPAPPRHS
jgi:anti-anti-sigma regulatory factor